VALPDLALSSRENGEIQIFRQSPWFRPDVARNADLQQIDGIRALSPANESVGHQKMVRLRCGTRRQPIKTSASTQIE
jgi:hypothetical protein